MFYSLKHSRFRSHYCAHFCRSLEALNTEIDLADRQPQSLHVIYRRKETALSYKHTSILGPHRHATAKGAEPHRLPPKARVYGTTDATGLVVEEITIT